ncbi:MAG: acrylyl-CoA reductase family protein [Acidimicrobiales bacterium]
MRAFVINEVEGSLRLGVEEREARATASDDLLVAVDYSGVNFKDALVASVGGRVRRVANLIGGVDAAGVIAASTHAQWPVGTRVAVHGGDMGVGRDGGFASFVYAPTRFLSALPDTISTRDAMIVGTAGFTAMASVLALEHHGLDDDGEVLVTGATGGVGSLALTFLTARGHQAVASTGSPAQSSWLGERGATRIIGRDEIADKPDRVLASERWSGAIDCIGGETLHHILRSLRYGAAVAASGLVASPELHTNVYPFITRAVSLLGIDAVEARSATRSAVWRAVGDVASSIDFEPLVDQVVALEDVPGSLEKIRDGKTRGRILVDTNR